MARYEVLAESYINGVIVKPGDVIEYDGLVRQEDRNLKPVDDKANVAASKADAQTANEALRAAAIAAKLTEDGKADGKPIDADTPIETVTLRLAEYKQANTFA